MFLSRAKELAKEMIPFWEGLHRHPELSFQEFKTTDRLKREVTSLDLDLLDLGMETGFVARLQGAKPGKRAAIRTDLDAIALLESPGHLVRSEVDGIMHACGHDFHMTSVLGAARLLKERQEALEGEIFFIFQPAEEVTKGAQAMLDRGLLDVLQGDIDALFGLHALPHYPVGTVLSSRDYASAGKTNFRVTLKGTGGHAGSPHEYRDVIPAGAALIQAVQTLVSRRSDPQEALVCTILTVQAGDRDFFVSDGLEMTGTIRAFDEEVQKRTERQLAELVENTAALYGCWGHIEMMPGVPAQRNHRDLFPAAQRACHSLFDEDRILTGPPPFLGSEDFAIFGRKIPSHFYWLGTGFPDRDNALLHQPDFLVNPQALPYGIALLAQSVFEVLQEE